MIARIVIGLILVLSVYGVAFFLLCLYALIAVGSGSDAHLGE